MKVIKPSVALINPPSYDSILAVVEMAGRVCYKSEHKITYGSAEKFVRGLIKRGHEAVIEHGNVTLRFICDRGVSHQIVRHRLASYCQESTRYCNYSKDDFGSEITVIEPCYLDENSDAYAVWFEAMTGCEWSYFELLNQGCTAQEARAVLPNSLKTEVVMTANMREWRHFCKLRTAPGAHPQMREVAGMALHLLKKNYPVFFEDFEEV